MCENVRGPGHARLQVANQGLLGLCNQASGCAQCARPSETTRARDASQSSAFAWGYVLEGSCLAPSGCSARRCTQRRTGLPPPSASMLARRRMHCPKPHGAPCMATMWPNTCTSVRVRYPHLCPLHPCRPPHTRVDTHTDPEPERYSSTCTRRQDAV